jgi:hypothetical protein
MDGRTWFWFKVLKEAEPRTKIGLRKCKDLCLVWRLSFHELIFPFENVYPRGNCGGVMLATQIPFMPDD